MISRCWFITSSYFSTFLTAPECRYEIVERGHEMRAEYWGGYTRHNVLWQQRFDADGVLLDEKPVVRNDAIMMYSPYLEEGGTSE